MEESQQPVAKQGDPEFRSGKKADEYSVSCRAPSGLRSWLTDSRHLPQLASLVVMVSFLGFLGMRMAADMRASSTQPPHLVSDTQVSEKTAGALTRDAQPEPRLGIVARLMRALEDAGQQPPAVAGEEISAAALAEHAEWVEEYFFELHSLETMTMADQAEVAGLGIISGRVRTLPGYPVEGIPVIATLREYFRNTGPVTHGSSKSEYKTTTNADGFYAFRDLPEGIYMVGVADTGLYSAARSEVHTGVKYADLVVHPQRHAKVRGIVTDTMGRAIDGARIMPLTKGIPAGAVSNDNGEFTLAVSIERELHSFPIHFQASGFRETRYEVAEADWSAGKDRLISVVMEPVFEFGTISGSVRDTEGLPAAGEIVRLYSPGLKRNYLAVADAGGEYEFAAVEVADDYQLWVRPSGPYRDYVEAKFAVMPGYDRHDIELESLDRGYRLSGRIVDHNGQPVAGLTLALYSRSATAQTLPVTSNPYGEFEVENVPAGELVFESRSMPYYSLTGLQLSGSDTEKHVELVVNRGQQKLLGRVVGSDGRPIAAPRIFITASQTINGIQSRSSSSTSADADGRFVFTDLSTGQHTITVNAPGYEGARLRPVVGSERELVIKLERKTT